MTKDVNGNGRYQQYALLVCLFIPFVSLIIELDKVANAQNITATGAEQAEARITNNAIVSDLQPLLHDNNVLTYTIFMPIIQAPLLQVDDFEDGQDPNQLGGPIRWYGDCIHPSPGGYDANNPYSGNYGYRLHYDVTETCYATWQTGLLGQNLTGYSVVVFQIKGANGGETPNIYLQTTATKRHYADIEDYLAAGQVTTGWQEARIPLSVFAAGPVVMENVTWFQIVFEWEDMCGTVYIDDIRFE